jgi:hypothetical protein
MNLIQQVLGWGAHPSYSKGTVGEWLAGTALIFLLAFLWTMTLREID